MGVQDKTGGYGRFDHSLARLCDRRRKAVVFLAAFSVRTCPLPWNI
jgi:hypothetical protein